MKKEHDDYLVQKYPKIFAERNMSMQESCMYWGFEHGDGWFWLLDRLCNTIQSYIDNNSRRLVYKNKYIRALDKKILKIMVKLPYKYSKHLSKFRTFLDKNFEKEHHLTIPQLVATQVKEKYGDLRFYYRGGDKYIHGMIALAESMSWYTCEVCGSTKDIIHTKGWIKTICKECNTPKE